MNRKRLRTILFPLLLVLVVLAAGCGSPADDNTTELSPDGGGDESPVGDASPAGDESPTSTEEVTATETETAAEETETPTSEEGDGLATAERGGRSGTNGTDNETGGTVQTAEQR